MMFERSLTLLLTAATAMTTWMNVQAFVVVPSSRRTMMITTKTASRLGLTTDDCQDLVAASEQFYDHSSSSSTTTARHDNDDDEDDDDQKEFDDEDEELRNINNNSNNDAEACSSKEEENAPSSSSMSAPRAAVALMRRLFANPTAAFHPHAAEGLDGYANGDDVVYFPIVGFTFVRDGPNHCRALPSISNPSCRIRGDVCDHEHYGTWSAAAPTTPVVDAAETKSKAVAP